MSIVEPVTSARIRPRVAPATPVVQAKSMPPAAQAIRTRLRQPAPVVQPVVEETQATPVASNSASVEAELNQLITDWALANHDKNKSTSAENRAKKAINEVMVTHELTSHAHKVSVGGNDITFTAAIKAKETEVLDPRKVFDFLGKDLEKFFKVVTIGATSFKDDYGQNAVIQCRTKVTKPADLAITKEK